MGGPKSTSSSRSPTNHHHWGLAYSISISFLIPIKNIFLLFSTFLQMVILATLFQCWSTLWNLALKITMLFWCSQRLLANINVEIDDVDSTMFNVASFNVDIHLVVSTLIWLCPTLKCHINLTATLRQRWKFS